MGNTQDSESFCGHWEMTNREKTRESRLGRFWCWKCDGYLIYEGQKCPRCGKRDFHNEMRSKK